LPDEIVSEEALGGQGFVRGAGASVIGERIDADATARGEKACYFEVSRFHEGDEVVEDDIDAIFVETAVVAEAEEVEFKGLALDHAEVGDVIDKYGGEVGLSGDGAEGGELGAVEADTVIAPGVFVGEGFEEMGSVTVGVNGGVSQTGKRIRVRIHCFHRIVTKTGK
jgi:hypothetical protein